MASPKVSEVALVMVIAAVLWNGAWAQSNCMTAIVSLSPCMNYVTGNSSAPSSSCCSQLSNVVQSTPQCLCSLLNGGGSTFGININQTLATALPGACKVQTPPVSRCNAANGPTSSAAVPPPATSPPVGSEAPSDSETPTTPSASGSTIPTSGSKTVPSTTGSSSAGSNVRVSFHILSFFLFAASWALSSVTI